MKILDLYNNSIELLKIKNISTYKLDAKILLSFLLKIKTENLILYFNKDVGNEFVLRFKLLLNRRLKNEPIANIINKKSFWNFDFFVNENVLTPRCDSEILIEAVLKDVKNINSELNILDLGTGSGCLILTLLKIYQNSHGLAVDISDKALEVAKVNAKNLNINNIDFLKNNWNDDIDSKFDVIISNPPYISKEDVQYLNPEVNVFNPMMALTDDNDGLDCYRYLAKNLYKNVKKNTKLFFEIGKDQEKDVQIIFEKNKFKLEKIYKDFSGINRVLVFSFDA